MNPNMEIVYFTFGLALAISLLFVIAIFIGHKLAMKAFSHVQPSAKEMSKLVKGGVTQERDYIEDAMNGIDPSKDPTMENMFDETGLPRELLGDKTATEFFKGTNPKDFYGYDVTELKEQEK